MKNIKSIFFIFLLFLSSHTAAWNFSDIWQTADQRGDHLLKANKAEEAAHVFTNTDWKAVALYRSADYNSAFQFFKKKQTSDGQYNAGNAAALQGHFKEAIAMYDKAIALNSNNIDAIANRDLIKKIMDKNKQSQKENSNQPEHKKNTQQNKSSSDKNTANNDQTSQNDQKQMDQANSQKQPNQTSNSNPASTVPGTQTTDSHSKNPKDYLATYSQNQSEDQKQLLRRLSDNPGSLLQQKFMRDYLRRHSGEPNQGDV